MKNNNTETKENNRKWQSKVKRVLAGVRRQYDVHNRNFEMADFHRICESEDIFVRREKMRPLGQYTTYKGHLWIHFREGITNDHILEEVAFHELGHHFLHRKDLLKHCFVDDKSEAVKQAEREASLFSYLALGSKLVRALPCELVSLEVTDDSLKELGIEKYDRLIINTYEAVGNGQMIVISKGDEVFCGLAKFIGDGKVRLDYIHSQEIFELSEVKIIGRAVSSQRDIRDFRLPEVKS